MLHIEVDLNLVWMCAPIYAYMCYAFDITQDGVDVESIPIYVCVCVCVCACVRACVYMCVCIQ